MQNVPIKISATIQKLLQTLLTEAQAKSEPSSTNPSISGNPKKRKAESSEGDPQLVPAPNENLANAAKILGPLQEFASVVAYAFPVSFLSCKNLHIPYL